MATSTLTTRRRVVSYLPSAGIYGLWRTRRGLARGVCTRARSLLYAPPAARGLGLFAAWSHGRGSDGLGIVSSILRNVLTKLCRLKFLATGVDPTARTSASEDDGGVAGRSIAESIRAVNRNQMRFNAPAAR